MIKKEFPVLDQGLKISLGFYKSALARNHHLADAAIQQIKKTKASTMLILGGFHTQAVRNLIQSSGIEVCVITPQFPPTYDDSAYERLLLQKSTRLGKLLSQAFSTLRQSPITERLDDFLTLQFEILERALSEFADLQGIREFIETSIENARESETLSPQLLDQLELKIVSTGALLLLGKTLALVIEPKNEKGSFWNTLELDPEEIFQQEESGPWSLQFVQNSEVLISKLKKFETSPSQIEIQFEKTPRNDRVWRFLSNPEFLDSFAGSSPQSPLHLKVQFKGKSNQDKKIYRVEIFGPKGEKVKSLILKVYDQNRFLTDKRRILQSWDRWNEMSRLDSEGISLARSLGYSEAEGIFAQEWIEGKSLDDTLYQAMTTRNLDLAKNILSKVIQNAVRLYLLSGRKFIPWDYLGSNLIEGRFVDEDEIPLEPGAHEIVSYLSIFSRNLQMYRPQISLEEEYEFLWQAILDAFEKESSRENGLDFLYEAYALANQEANHRLLDPELNFSGFLLREYLRSPTGREPKKLLSLEEIEDRISQLQGTVEYQRKLISGRPLKPGQVSLHIGLHSSAVFPLAEAMSGLRVFGIDIQDLYIKSPQKRAKKGLGNLLRRGFFLPKFFRLNAEDLDEDHGFLTDSIDHITMKELFGGFLFKASPEKIVENIIRLLKEGGSVLLTDVHLHEDSRNPTEVELLRTISEESKEWDVEWEIESLGIKDHYEHNVFLATLKKKSRKGLPLGPDQPLYDFIERLRGEIEKLLPEGRKLLNEYLDDLEKGKTMGFRDLYQTYLKTKERISNLPYQFALWILRDFPPSTGKRHVVFIQRRSNTLGNLIKTLAKELEWNHLTFHDVYMNHSIAGFKGDALLETQSPIEFPGTGKNSPEEIFQYLVQENLLDGTPILFIDTGMIGSNPLFLRKLIADPQRWENQGLHYHRVDVSTRLYFFDPPSEKEEKVRLAHEGQIQGFNEILENTPANVDAYDLSYFLDKGVKHTYLRPKRLIWREDPDDKKIEPELLPNDPFTLLVALVQRLAAEDIIREKLAQDDLPIEQLKAQTQSLKPPIPDDQRVLLTDQKIEGVLTQGLPKNKRIAILEDTELDATPFAGNLIQRLSEKNRMKRFSLRRSSLDQLASFLSKFQPDFILLPQDRSDFEFFIQTLANETQRPVTLLFYASLDLLPFENLFYPFSSETAEIVKSAIQAHKSQVERTAYDKVFDYFSNATGQRLRLDKNIAGNPTHHAQTFKVGFIEKGEVAFARPGKLYQVASRRGPSTLAFDPDIPILVVSPHADDLEIAAGGLIRSELKKSQRSSNPRVLNWIFGTGDEWGVILDPNHPAQALAEKDQIAYKRSIRKKEAMDAAMILSGATPGEIEVSVLGLPSASRYPQGPGAILSMIDPQVLEDLEVVKTKLDAFFAKYSGSFKKGGVLTVVLPHFHDDHPHHQMATQIALEALKQFSSVKEIPIQLIFYNSPWAGRYNTYYVSSKDPTLKRRAHPLLSEKISISDKIHRSLGIILGELLAGFGRKPLTPKELGGELAERFLRKTFFPRVPQASINMPSPTPQTLEFRASQRTVESAA